MKQIAKYWYAAHFEDGSKSLIDQGWKITHISCSMDTVFVVFEKLDD